LQSAPRWILTDRRGPDLHDKMLAANWSDSQAIVADAAKKRAAARPASVPPYTPSTDRRPWRGVHAIAPVPTAYAFTRRSFAGFMEQQAREPGISEIREGITGPCRPGTWGGG
jgi:hypothetical protein